MFSTNVCKNHGFLLVDQVFLLLNSIRPDYVFRKFTIREQILINCLTFISKLNTMLKLNHLQSDLTVHGFIKK